VFLLLFFLRKRVSSTLYLYIVFAILTGIPLQTRATSKLSSAFSGTQDKCATCQKTVYPLEKVTKITNLN
jgi:hypothetical protein